MIEAMAVRIARPCTDLAAAERFYVDGLGCTCSTGSPPTDPVSTIW